MELWPARFATSRVSAKLVRSACCWCSRRSQPGIVIADVIVLANRTGGPLTVRFMPLAGQAEQVALAPGDVTPMFVDGAANVAFGPAAGGRRYLLDANCAYYFGRRRDGQIDLQKIGLGEDATTGDGRELPGSARRAPTATIPVKILVDEEEPGRQAAVGAATAAANRGRFRRSWKNIAACACTSSPSTRGTQTTPRTISSPRSANSSAK